VADDAPVDHSLSGGQKAGLVALSAIGLVGGLVGSATPSEAGEVHQVRFAGGGPSGAYHGGGGGAWHGDGGWHGGGWHGPVAIPVPVPYPNGGVCDRGAPYRPGYGPDGQVHNIDRFGNVNDGNVHYDAGPYGPIAVYDNGTCW